MEDLFQCIYDDLMGETAVPSAPFPVENAFCDGAACAKLYAEIYESKIKVCDRLHVEEDRDLEEICDHFWDIMKVISRKMYEYGAMQHPAFRNEQTG